MNDPSRTSHYVDDAFYAGIVAAFTDWQRDERVVGDPALREACHALLLREARLLDNLAFDAWLGLFVPECAYWAPGSPQPGDPRKEIALWFDDRRQLEGRVYRLKTGHAWSQVPPSRTARLVGNVEVFSGGDALSVMVRSTFVVHEFRAGTARAIAGWCGHRLRYLEGALRIQAKQVNLLEADQNLRNPSLLL